MEVRDKEQYEQIKNNINIFLIDFQEFNLGKKLLFIRNGDEIQTG